MACPTSYPHLFSARRNDRAQPVQGSVYFMDIHVEYKLPISHPTPFPGYDDFIFAQKNFQSIPPIALMAISEEAESPGQPPLESAIKDTLGMLFNSHVSIHNLMLSQRMLLCLRNGDRQFQTLNDQFKFKWHLFMVNAKFKA